MRPLLPAYADPTILALLGPDPDARCDAPGCGHPGPCDECDERRLLADDRECRDWARYGHRRERMWRGEGRNDHADHDRDLGRIARCVLEQRAR